MSLIINPPTDLYRPSKSESVSQSPFTSNTQCDLQPTQHLNNQACHILALPAELRNIIYISALTHLEPLSLTIHNDMVALPPDQAISIAPQLLATCRLINHEATSILYSLSTLSVRNTSYIPPALEALEAGAQHIRSLEISHMTGGEVAELVEFLPKLCGLEKIIVHNEFCRYTNDHIRVVRRLGPLVRALHTRSKVNGAKAALEILELPIGGEDGKWWRGVEEALKEMIEFVDATVGSGGRGSNF